MIIQEPKTLRTFFVKRPGWYRWWMDADKADALLRPFGVDIDRLLSRTFENGKTYVAVYFGMSKDLLNRLKWHICQKHTTSEIKSGYISTFRQTLSGVLGLDASLSENAVNDLLDNYCLVEYDYTETEEEAKQREDSELCAPDYYYPLNIQGNKSVPKTVRQQIQAARQQHKK